MVRSVQEMRSIDYLHTSLLCCIMAELGTWAMLWNLAALITVLTFFFVLYKEW